MELKKLLKPRELYRQAIRRPNENEIADTVDAKSQFESLLNHQGWKRIERFIQLQEDGIMATMKIGIRPDPIFGKTRIQKYDDMQSELKAYRKIRKFIEMTIQNGKRYEQRAAKATKKSE